MVASLLVFPSGNLYNAYINHVYFESTKDLEAPVIWRGIVNMRMSAGDNMSLKSKFFLSEFITSATPNLKH